MDVDDDAIQAEFERSYTGKHEQFKEALLKARDYLGELLAHTWDKLSADNLTYNKVGLELIGLIDFTTLAFLTIFINPTA